MKHEAGAVLFTINLKSIATFYERVMGMKVLMTADDSIRLESGSFRLTVHAIPARDAKNITIETPPDVREAAAVTPSVTRRECRRFDRSQSLARVDTLA